VKGKEGGDWVVAYRKSKKAQSTDENLTKEERMKKGTTRGMK